MVVGNVSAFDLSISECSTALGINVRYKRAATSPSSWNFPWSGMSSPSGTLAFRTLVQYLNQSYDSISEIYLFSPPLVPYHVASYR